MSFGSISRFFVQMFSPSLFQVLLTLVIRCRHLFLVYLVCYWYLILQISLI